MLGKVRADAPDRPLLVVAPRDGRLHLRGVEGLPEAPPENEALQLVLLVKARHAPGRVKGIVPESGLVAVGEEKEGPLPVHLLEAIGVELGLLLALLDLLGRLLRLDDRERFAVVAPEHVVRIAEALAVGHAGDLVFLVALLVERPAGAAQVDIDQVAAGLGLGVVVRVLLFRVGLADGGQLRLRLLQLRVDGIEFLLLLEGRFVARLQLGLEFGQALARHRGGRWGSAEGGRGLRPLDPANRGRSARRIGPRQPVEQVVQLLEALQGVILPDGVRAVRGEVARLLHRLRLLKDRLREQVAKGRLMEERPEVLVIGHLELPLMPVEPVHHRLEGKPRLKAGRARIAVEVSLRVLGRFGDGAKGLGQEVEVRHQASLW